MRPATAVANHLIQLARKSGQPLTGSQLQHLVYFAHGLRLALVNEPLLDEAVLADAEGVSIQGLKAHGIEGDTPVSGLIRLQNEEDQTPQLDSDDMACATLDMVWQRFGSFTAQHMGFFARSGDGPWDLTWHSAERENRDSLTLANSSIRQWFRKLLIQENRDRASADGLEQTVMISHMNFTDTLVPR